MVWLARTVFGNTAERPGLLVARREDGSRLFPTSSSIKDYLLDHVISATYATTMVQGLENTARLPERALSDG